MQVETQHYGRFSSIPYKAGVEILNQIQSPDHGAVVFGASGKMGSAISSTFPKASVRTTMQDVDKEKLEEAKANALQTIKYGVKKRKVSTYQWVNISNNNLFHETIAFPNRGAIPFSQIDEAYVKSPEEARKAVSAFLDTVLGQGSKTRANYSNLMMVLEAGPETLRFKQDVLRFLELALQSENAVLATNTSSLKIDEIAAKVEHPERVVGFHYFFPADRNSLVEIIVGSKTSLEVVQAMHDLVIAMGKKPVISWKDSPGAVANRILVGLLVEAAKMLQEGIAPTELIDKVFLETFYPEQIKVQTAKAKRQFEAAPKLSFFKDETRLYKKIAECDAKVSEVSKQGNDKLKEELLRKKKSYIEEAQINLGQKVLYTKIVDIMSGETSGPGSFYRAPSLIKDLQVKAQGQLNIINKYLSKVKEAPEKITGSIEEVTREKLTPYDLPVPTNPMSDKEAREIISNRLKGTYIAIAQQILNEGLATPQDIELMCKEGFKYNIGPLELAKKLGSEKVKELTTLVNKGLDQSKPTGICKPGEYIELTSNELSGIQTYIQDNVGFINMGRLHIQNLAMTQNSLSPHMLEAILESIQDLKAKGVKAIIFKNQGGGAFSSGADLNYIASTNWNIEKILAFKNLGKRVMDEIANCSVPTIAVVDGAAVGGGLELALACDYRIMTDLSFVAMPEVGLGIIPDWGGTERLPAIIGKELAKRLICTAKLKNLGLKLGGEDAYKVGLADVFTTQAKLPYTISDLISKAGPIDIYKKSPKKENYDKKVEELPTHIVKRFALDKPFKHNLRWVTKHAAYFAEDLIEHSDDPEYAKRFNDDEAFKVLIKSGKKVANRYIDPFISAAKSRFWAPIFEKLGLL